MTHSGTILIASSSIILGPVVIFLQACPLLVIAHLTMGI